MESDVEPFEVGAVPGFFDAGEVVDVVDDVSEVDESPEEPFEVDFELESPASSVDVDDADAADFDVPARASLR